MELSNLGEDCKTVGSSKGRVTFQLGSGNTYDASATSSDDKFCSTDEKHEFKSVDEHSLKENTAENQSEDSEKDEDGKITNSFTSVTKYILNKSSIYAVSQVGKAESPFRKLLWVLVLAVALLGCGYEIYRFLILYFQYPVVINLHVENEKSLEFPAVTICNLNRMRKVYEICLEYKYSHINCSTLSESDRKLFSEMIENRRLDSLFDQYNSELNDKRNFLIQYSLLDSDSRKAFGHQINDLIRGCSFNGEPCSFHYFSYLQSLRYGNCYTFNKFSVEDDTVLKTSSVGMINGLDLVLNFDPEDYVPVTTSVGARVIIHDPRDDPNPSDEGVNIGPGFETTLAIKQTCVSRLPTPYKDHCITYGTDKSARGGNRKECVRSCIQEENYARCSCTDPTLPTFNNYRHCNVSDLTEFRCLDTTLKSMARGQLPCNCPLPCFTTTYDLRTSTAVWPSGFNHFESFCSGCADEKQALEIARKNQSRLKIYYSTLERTVYEQQAMFQDSELFSQLGGQFGLWMGMSIVAAFELAENIMYLCRYCGALALDTKTK